MTQDEILLDNRLIILCNQQVVEKLIIRFQSNNVTKATFALQSNSFPSLLMLSESTLVPDPKVNLTYAEIQTLINTASSISFARGAGSALLVADIASMQQMETVLIPKNNNWIIFTAAALVLLFLILLTVFIAYKVSKKTHQAATANTQENIDTYKKVGKKLFDRPGKRINQSGSTTSVNSPFKQNVNNNSSLIITKIEPQKIVDLLENNQKDDFKDSFVLPTEENNDEDIKQEETIKEEQKEENPENTVQNRANLFAFLSNDFKIDKTKLTKIQKTVETVATPQIMNGTENKVDPMKALYERLGIRKIQ
ncbi:Hypothetical_protein [Hexamita inflata]|uniref:Hypothetical_protein n=1 Tax=Hexamita inflata TaxID=28002 RepID=A0AA86UAG9_9EUKA|nr:Hypothetical protein HINF_LOCUS35384 [Hexamita inflata]